LPFSIYDGRAMAELRAPFAGTVVAVARGPGEAVSAHAAVIVLEAMKMEHELTAETDGVR
jgi:acetyl-CoA/propionyl-CoA carboxylase biotin carboxyl carrier protein